MTSDDRVAVPEQIMPCRWDAVPGGYGAVRCRSFLLINPCLQVVAVVWWQEQVYQKCCILRSPGWKMTPQYGAC